MLTSFLSKLCFYKIRIYLFKGSVNCKLLLLLLKYCGEHLRNCTLAKWCKFAECIWDLFFPDSNMPTDSKGANSTLFCTAPSPTPSCLLRGKLEVQPKEDRLHGFLSGLRFASSIVATSPVTNPHMKWKRIPEVSTGKVQNIKTSFYLATTAGDGGAKVTFNH